MGIIRYIRVYAGKLLLQKQAKNLRRAKQMHNIETARSIGIIYVYKNEIEFRVIEGLIRDLRERKKDVKALVYLPYINLLEYIPQKLSIDFVTPNDLSFYYHLQGTRVHDFIARDFDILLDFNFMKFFPLETVTAISHAKFKVGYYDDDHLAMYDMILKSNIHNLEEVIKHSMHYLEMVTPG